VEIKKMLETLKIESLDELVGQAMPKSILLNKPFTLPGEDVTRGEYETLNELRGIMDNNKVLRTFIGMGYYNNKLPSVILRNVVENPLWYTPYTPYQAEISQGRLESLLNFQTMVADLTGMKLANASLLDEATACGEAMVFAIRNSKLKNVNSFLVSPKCHPQSISVIETRAEPLGIEVIIADPFEHDYESRPVAGVLVQYPDTEGLVDERFSKLTQTLKEKGVFSVFSTDLLALTLLTPPGDLGADIAVGTSQRFGVPLGYGGPHAGFFAISDASAARKIPGRVVGVSQDTRGRPALRLSLQTREQHIKREKATSNICTAQALLANVSAFYAVYHGPEGLKEIAQKVHKLTLVLAEGLSQLGLNVEHQAFFDTITVRHSSASSKTFLDKAVEHGMNLRAIDEHRVGISLDETTEFKDVQDIWRVFAEVTGKTLDQPWANDYSVLANQVQSPVAQNSTLARTSKYLENEVFNRYHIEHALLRYIYRLSSKDISLCTSMIPLGSCTMKLNAASEMIPITWGTANIHPFVPLSQAGGYQRVIEDLQKFLAQITGLHSVSLQPNSGASGEYTGLMTIRKYHEKQGEGHRNVVLIPSSAHGTNPASAALAGMKIVVVQCEPSGYVSLQSLREKVEQHSKTLAAFMITYPSTYGIFEENIKEVCQIIHSHGGQVYLDGANMNALVGLSSLKDIGADVCHMNLHKTFCIPHGGGGPGMGPIAVAEHLAPFLPSHPVVSSNSNPLALGPVSAAPWGSTSILLITWMYIKMMGAQGLRKATQVAILNANYMKERLKDHYQVKFTSAAGKVAHEFIVDFRPFKKTTKVEATDVAKRLMDYNFHAPTMSWPVAGTLMIEPTESENLEEVDRLCDALIQIRQEIREIENGEQPDDNNVLKRAPHVAEELASGEWDRPYSREKAAYPLPYLREHKFWPSVTRVDNEFGDINLVCSCPPMDSYL